jgi:hypothetical protein
MKLTAYRWLANFLDIVHIPLAIAVCIFGKSWLPKPLWIGILIGTVALQIICLGCPITVFTCWLRRKYDPDYKVTGSITMWLYRRYGRLVGLPILVVLIIASLFFSYLGLKLR